MKQLFFLCFTIFIGNTTVSAQNIKEIDSLSVEMCNTLSKKSDLSGEKKIEATFQKHLVEYFQKINVSTQAEADSISTRIFFRLQKNCTAFTELLGALEENKSDWVKLTEKPISKIAKKDFTSFAKGGQFFYKEYDGTTVSVVVTKNSWTETFADGTTSKLTFVPKDNNEFELIFIESNNETRKNFSVKGDKYKYGIYDKNKDGLQIWTTTEDNVYLGFTLYNKL